MLMRWEMYNVTWNRLITCRASLCLWDFALPSVPPPPVYTWERQRHNSTTTTTIIIMCLSALGKDSAVDNQWSVLSRGQSTCCVRRPPAPQKAPPPEAPRPGPGGSDAGPLGSETAMTPGDKKHWLTNTTHSHSQRFSKRYTSSVSNK